MIISLIAAIGKNFEIGYEGKLLWHISEDLKFFKATTTGHTVIMGRKTFESIGSKPLKNRRNIVVTRQKDYTAENIEVAGSLEQAFELARNDGEVFILGGEQIFREALSRADKLYLTRVEQGYKADTFFPPYNQQEWKCTVKSPVQKDPVSGIEFSFETLVRVRQNC